MENFRRDNRSGGRRDNRRFNDRSSGRPSMHSAVCSDCGRDCEVPFRPTGDKPVFFSNCFENRGNQGPRRSNERDSRRPDRGDSRRFGSDKKMYQAVCDKCGRDCEVPFRPSNDKPIYCDNCFGKGDKGKSQDKGNKQLDAINNKLDEILKVLSNVVQVEEVKEQEVVKEEVKEVKKAKPKKVAKAKEKKVAPAKKEKSKPKAKTKDKPKAKTKDKPKTTKKK